MEKIDVCVYIILFGQFLNKNCISCINHCPFIWSFQLCVL